MNSSDLIALFKRLSDKGANATSNDNILSENCFWLAYMSSATTSENTTVSGSLFSTCGVRLDIVSTTTEYEGFARAINCALLVFCVVAMIVVYGVHRQRQYVQHSRTRISQMSSWQVLTIVAWVVKAMFYAEAVLHAVPTCHKSQPRDYFALCSRSRRVLRRGCLTIREGAH